MDFLKIKVCGITNEEDYVGALKLGVDYVGFIFYEKSPRYLNLEEVTPSQFRKEIGLKRVGVFVNQPISQMLTIARQMKLDVLQIHGDEDEDYLKELEKIIGESQLEVECWRALRIDDQTNLEEIFRAISTSPIISNLLLETKSEKPNLYGGTGKSIDQSLLLKTVEEYQKSESNQRLILSGGLNKDNYRQLLSPWETLGLDYPKGLDFNSGVEVKPGKKSFLRMKEVVESVHLFKKEHLQREQ